MAIVRNCSIRKILLAGYYGVEIIQIGAVCRQTRLSAENRLNIYFIVYSRFAVAVDLAAVVSVGEAAALAVAVVAAVGGGRCCKGNASGPAVLLLLKVNLDLFRC